MRHTIEKIMLIDDDPDECFLFRKAVSEISSALEVQFINDCDDLVPTLLSKCPDLLFMDINMPKKDGFDCIYQLRAQPQLKALPVVMYSSSDYEKEISKAYAYGANLYLRKPPSYEGLVLAIKAILVLNWTHPEKITDSFFVGGRYHPFEVA